MWEHLICSEAASIAATHEFVASTGAKNCARVKRTILESKMSGMGQRKRAYFRFSVVSKVQALVCGGMGVAAALSEIARENHLDPAGKPRRVGRSTLYRWYREYEASGVAALEDRGRAKTKTSQALPERFLSFLKTEKNLDSDASVPELIRRAREQGVVPLAQPLSRSTVYRACRRMNLALLRQPAEQHRSMRRFAYPHRMQMVLCDGKHFRAGASRRRRVAMFFLDDATRFCLHVVVGTSENRELFLRGLFEALLRCGFMTILYLDHGPGFIAEWAVEITAKCGISLVHGSVSYPEGHGKIERFHRTASSAVLRRLDGRAEVDPECGALELRLQHYARECYNRQPHESLGGVVTPEERFLGDSKPLRFPENTSELREKFIIYESKKVSRDNCVSIDGTVYETPLGSAGKRVTVARHVLAQQFSVQSEGKQVFLAPVDRHHNATREPKPRRSKTEQLPLLPKSAAELAYERDFAPLVSADGGYTHKEKE